MVTFLFITSCDKKVKPDDIKISTSGVYILNSGNYASNDANLAFYDPSSGRVVHNVFNDANGMLLGDTAQDMLIYGSKMYIAVYNSKVLFVTNLQGKLIEELRITADDTNLSPRELIGHNGKVYVSLYEGYLAQIDTTSYKTVLTKVGNNPEGVAVSREHIYVANSGGMNWPNCDNTVSKVEISTMKEVAKIEVITNPVKIVTNIFGEIFVSSCGNYGDISSSLQRIDPITNEVTKLSERAVESISMSSESKLYFLSPEYDENNNVVAAVGVYNTLTKEFEEDLIPKGSKVIKNNPYGISVDPASGDIYIGSSDYSSEGDMYRFNSKGELITSFGTGGLNPMGAYFLLEVKN